MNIQVEVDITPEELRRLMGLPDLQAFHESLLEQIRERMLAGYDGYDPLKLFQPYMSSAVASWETFQKLFGAALQGVAKSSPDAK
jgi:hypothetical protein